MRRGVVTGTDVKTVSFDLDNTLWDVGPVLEAAERALRAWLESECPRALSGYRPERVVAVREEIAEQFPERAHDLTFLRKAVLERILGAAGYPATRADAAFQVFFEARNQVTLFADVLPALRRLRTRFELVALTDGNADLERVGLQAFFGHCINASTVGRAKPHAAMFQAVETLTGNSPEQILHVGDDPHRDVAGARAYGFRAVWVNRRQDRWPLEDAVPDAEVADLAALVESLLD